MVDLFPNLHLPKIDFSGIAEIPGLIQGAQDEATTKASLAGLDATDAKSMREAGNRLLATGTTKGIETGMRLLTAAQAKENADITRARDASYMTSVAPAMAALLGGRSAGAPGATPAVPENAPTPSFGPGPEAPAPVPVAPPPPPTGLSPSQLPPAPAGVPPMVPGPRAEGPSDQMIAQAQGAIAPPPAPGPQLAGPPPEAIAPPGGPPGAVPFMGAPDMTRAGGLPPPPPQAAPPPPVAPVAPPKMPPAPGADVAGRTNELLTAEAGMGPKAVAQRAAIAQAAKNEQARSTTSSPEYKQYYNDQADRYVHGQPPQSIIDWRAEVKNASTLTEKTHDVYVKDYREKGRQAESVGNALDAMGEIMRNPKFAPGEVGWLHEGAQRFAAINDQLRSLGVPDSILMSREQIKTLTTPAALREAFASIASQSVISALGGLGRGISETDRDYMAKAFGTLALTKEGTTQINKFLSEVADRHKFQVKAAQDYINDNQRATPAKMDQYVNNATLKQYGTKGLLSYENGNPTQLKLKMDEALQPRVKVGDTVLGPGGVPHVIGPDGVPRPVGQQGM